MASARFKFVGYALAGAALASCKDRPPPPPSPAPPTTEQVGGCENLDLKGTCTFAVPTRVGGNEPASEARYELKALFDSGNHHVVATVATLLVPEEKSAELERYYLEHAKLPCSCHLVKPPCNPDMTSIQVAIDAPKFAHRER